MSVLDDLFAAAKAAQEKAYVPYSRFRVGAAILADDGCIYAGCNVENAAYPSGACAEVGAVSAMMLGGGKQITALMVVGDGDELCTPCGNCRQRIREFAS
ncbi:MAG: cytidine deaminase, partial [Beijerinckiaceae bacterium]